MRPHVSFSELQAFKTGCRFRWKLEQLDGIHLTPAYGVNLDFGTAIHEAIEKYKTRKDPFSLDATVEHFKKTINELFDKNWSKYPEKDQKYDREALVNSGVQILRRFDECQELRDAEVLYNEHKLFVPVDRTDGIDIKFKGYIDMVIKTKDKRGNTILYVVDFKSCTWGWNREKKMDQQAHSQLFLYKHFLCKKFNLDPAQVRTAFGLLKKTPQKGDSPVEFLPISAGPVSVQRALDGLGQIITEMAEVAKTGNAPKDRTQCTNKWGQVCPFLNTEHCPPDSQKS